MENLSNNIMAVENAGFSIRGLQAAWRQTAKWAQNVYPYFDALEASEFNARNLQELLDMNAALTAQTYDFSPYYSFTIPKPSGGTRAMAQPQMRDDIVAQAIINDVGPYLRSKIPDQSFAYQAVPTEGSDDIFLHWGRCYSEYVTSVEESIALHRDAFLVRTDIANFYHSVNQDFLMLKLGEVLAVSLGPLRFLEKLVRYQVIGSDGSTMTGNGLPIAPAYSHLLANFYLSSLDHKWIERTLAYARYVDDIVVVVSSESEAQTFVSGLDQDLAALGLSRNLEKTEVSQITKSESFIDQIRTKKYRINLRWSRFFGQVAK